MADSIETRYGLRGPFGVWRALKWSLAGLRHAWSFESSFRLEVALFAVLAPLGLWLGDNGAERAILVGSLMLVLIVEVINSAVEAVVDRFGGEHHSLSGRAKDLGSASVFLADLLVIVCWACILLPRYLD